MKNLNILAGTALTILFLVCAYLFWAIPYRSLLSYHEQFQLFLLSTPYLTEHLQWPGGMATYVAEFFVQLFNNYWIGAAVVALALLLIQRLTWRITCRYTRAFGALRFVLSFLPAIAVWAWMGDINAMFAYVIALIAVLVCFYAYTAIKSLVWRAIAVAFGIPFIYWLAGPMAYLFALLVGLDLVMNPGRPYLKGVLSFLILAYIVGVVLLSTLFLNYPTYQIFIGINYYRLQLALPPMMIIVPAVELAVVGICALLRGEHQLKAKSGRLIAAAACIVTAIIGYVSIVATFDPRIHELTQYDYLIRTNRWDDIIKMAQRKSPNSPLSMCATNLALGMTNQLNTRPFEFNQHGVAGLIPPFQRDANSSIVTAEIFYQLGLINSAQRLMFESMEAITNYNKSSRCIKRLAETNMLRGDYAVAEKYLKMLDKTLFYSKWAKRMRQLINTPEAIDNHPLYGRLRRMQIDDAFLFSEIEMDKILGQLYMANHDNTLAKQYLMIYPLLQRDLDKFMQYLQVVQLPTPYRPLLCQQAVAFAYVKAGMDLPDGLIDPPVLQHLREFAQTYTAAGKDSPVLDRFRGTPWYYLAVSE